MPEPRISIQPVCLQVAQPPPAPPVPPQIWHCTSISADGSVNGKNDGRNRTRVSAVKKRRANVASVALKATKGMRSSTARPSRCSHSGGCGAPPPELALARGERGFELALQGVGGGADLFLRGGIEPGHAGEDRGEGAGLAPQDLGLEIGEPALVRLRNLLQTLPQLGDGCQEVAHRQRACFATSASCSNATGSRTARSASTLRLISTPAFLRPFIRRL